MMTTRTTLTAERRHWRAIVALAALLVSQSAVAATVQIVVQDPPGFGFNDPGPPTNADGNAGTTLGEERLFALQAAADAWGARLKSDVVIQVAAEFDSSQFCQNGSATLASAGPLAVTVERGPDPQSTEDDTLFPVALGSARAGEDLDETGADIRVRFNPNLDTSNCLGAPWSYEVGEGAQVTGVSFFETAIHELAHGLGFLTFTNRQTGAYFAGIPDRYARLLTSESSNTAGSTGTPWTDLDDAGRAASSVDTNRLTWSGVEVGNVAGLLNSGAHPAGRVRMYAPSSLQGGSSVSHFDTSLSPDEIMEPIKRPSPRFRLTNHLMLDLGWTGLVELDVAITDGQDSRQAGQASTYTITLTHSGPADMSIVDARVVNTPPAGFAASSWTCAGAGGAVCSAPGGGATIDTRVTVPQGGTITLQSTGTVATGFTGTLTNSVNVTLPANIENLVASSASDDTTVTPAPGISVSGISGDTTEAGGTASFTVTLEAPPSDTVTLPLDSNDPGEGTVPANIVFTPGNWDTPQVVTVTGVNDDEDDGDQSYQIRTRAAQSNDAGYDGINPPNVNVVNRDDDTAGIAVSAISGNTSEAGGTATFTVSLDSRPTAEVSIGLSSSDPGEGVPDRETLTIMPEDWDQPQLITVTGVNDDVDDGDRAFTIVTAAVSSADGTYGGLNPVDVGVTNLDNDTAGISVSAISANTTEAGASATFTVVLASEPLADVSIPIVSDSPAEGTASVASLVFTPANWDSVRQVTVTGVDDDVDDGDQDYVIVTGAASSADGNYSGLDPADVSVTNEDDDTAGITVSGINGNTTEADGAASFTVVLDSEPLADVTIGLSSSNEDEGTVDEASITFSPANWDSARQVTVTGVDDDLVDGEQVFTVVTAPASSADGNYNGLDPVDVSVTNEDDDSPGVSVSPISGNTTEAGGTATFTVVLFSEPTAEVIVALSSSDPGEGTVSDSSVTLHAGNWDTPQVLTVSGVDDDVDDGNQEFTIVTSAAQSTDPVYANRTVNDVIVTNEDDDTAGITVSAVTGSPSESGAVANFTVVLDSEPLADVTIGLTSSDSAEGRVSPGSLVFTPTNWDTPQVVTITGADDDIDDGDREFTIVTAAAASSDTRYANRPVSDVIVTNADDDTAGISVSPVSGAPTEDGEVATFTVVLDSEPVADVTIALVSSDEGEGVVAPSSLRFTAANWHTPQAVTVTGVDDNMRDGAIEFTVSLGPAVSGDAGYAGSVPASLPLSNADNDSGPDIFSDDFEGNESASSN